MLCVSLFPLCSLFLCRSSCAQRHGVDVQSWRERCRDLAACKLPDRWDIRRLAPSVEYVCARVCVYLSVGQCHQIMYQMLAVIPLSLYITSDCHYRWLRHSVKNLSLHIYDCTACWWCNIALKWKEVQEPMCNIAGKWQYQAVMERLGRQSVIYTWIYVYFNEESKLSTCHVMYLSHLT